MRPRALLALLAFVAPATAAAGATPARGQAAPRCAWFPDAVGDDRMRDTGLAEDPALDVVRVTQSVRRGTFYGTVTLARLGDPTWADGGQYGAGFTVNGRRVLVFGTRSRTLVAFDPAFATRGVEIDGSYVDGTERLVTFAESRETGSVVVSVRLAELSPLVRADVPGATVAALRAEVLAVYGSATQPYDEAAAPPSARFVLRDCR